MIKHLVLYHEDNDGYCSAAIVKKYLDYWNVPGEAKFVPLDYHKVEKFLDWFEGFMKNQDNNLRNLIILDFSFGENWKRLLNVFPMENIVWIDHHKNAIENDYGTNICEAGGMRDSSNAACMLTWKYFFPYVPAPMAVKLVEDYDIWKFQFGEDTKAFMYATQAGGKHITNPESELWEILLDEEGFGAENYSKFINSMLVNGNTILRYVKATNEENCIAKAYISYYGESDVRCVVCNYGRGSAIFDSVTHEYDMMVVYWFDGEQYNYSFYSKTGGMDVSIIAREHGGNGHPNAAGCRSKKMLFPKNAEVRWSVET
jgi:uncharacterized protein